MFGREVKRHDLKFHIYFQTNNKADNKHCYAALLHFIQYKNDPQKIKCPTFLHENGF